MARRDPVGNTNFDDKKRFFVTHACLSGVATNIPLLPVASDRSRVASREHCQLCFFDREHRRRNFGLYPVLGPSVQPSQPAVDEYIMPRRRVTYSTYRAQASPSAHLHHRSTGHPRSTGAHYGGGRYAVPPIAAWRTLLRRATSAHAYEALLRIRFGRAIGQRGRAIASPRRTTLAAPLRGKLVGAVPE